MEHIKILQQVHPLIPKGAKVVLVGDGEFDGINLKAVIDNWKWHYAWGTFPGFYDGRVSLVPEVPRFLLLRTAMIGCRCR